MIDNSIHYKGLMGCNHPKPLVMNEIITNKVLVKNNGLCGIIRKIVIDIDHHDK